MDLGIEDKTLIMVWMGLTDELWIRGGGYVLGKRAVGSFCILKHSAHERGQRRTGRWIRADRKAVGTSNNHSLQPWCAGEHLRVRDTSSRS